MVRDPVLIIGMHRSGTSMVSKLLSICGLNLGDEAELIPAHEYDNPEGYWEHHGLVKIADTVLHKLGGSWDAPPELLKDPDWIGKVDLEDEYEEAQKTLAQLMEANSPWGFKDPRNTVLIPFWKKLFPNLKLIVCLRNPLEVAYSLSKRIRFHVEFSQALKLWQDYYDIAGVSLEDTDHLITHYQSHFYNSELEITRLCEFAELKLGKRKIKKAAIAVNSELYRGIATNALLQNYDGYPEGLLQLYDYYQENAGDVFHQLNQDKVYLGDQKKEAFDRLFEVSVLALDKKSEVIKEQEFSEAALKNIVAQKDIQLVENTNHLREKDKLLTDTNKQIEDKDIQLLEKEQLLRGTEKQLVEKDRQLLGADKQLVKKDQQLLDAGKQLVEKDQQFLDAGKQLVEKEQQVLEAGKQLVEKDQQLLDAGKQLLEKDKQLADADNLHLEKDKQLNDVEKQIIEKDQQIEDQLVQILKKKHEVEIQQAHLLESNLIISRLNDGINNLENNKKWKFVNFLNGLKYFPFSIVTRLRYAIFSKKLKAIIRIPPLFDSRWYADQNVDVAISGINLYYHYSTLGWKEGRSPNPLFDPSWYLNSYHDVARSKLDPLFHYLVYGWKEGRKPGPFFDPSWYLEINPDVAAEKIEPLTHYLMHGWEEGRSPSPNFNVDEYTSYYSFHIAIPSHPLLSSLLDRRNRNSEQAKVDHAEGKEFFEPSNRELEVSNEKRSEDFLKAEELLTYEPRKRQEIFNPGVNLLAYYLPQFHPIPENDTFWGKGFTEWTNVVKARPLFKGHYQPRLPGELGFYDLRLVEVMRQQAALAKQFGVYGFCFHYYWFNGKHVLERPIEQLYTNADIDINYCLSWANENWTRKWDGEEKDILLEQVHTLEDDMAFIKSVEKFFHDPRYIKIEGKPLLQIYRPQKMRDPKETAYNWRNYCKSLGYDGIFLVAAQAFGFNDPREIGFDALSEFPPLLGGDSSITRALEYFADFEGYVWDYNEIADKYESQQTDYILFKSVMPSWDNTARIGNKAHIFHGSTPGRYKSWLKSAIRSTLKYNRPEHRYVFINAWNEWAEGAYLEPDRNYGYAYLNATGDALVESLVKEKSKVLFVGHDAARAGAQKVLLHLLQWIKKYTDLDIYILLLSGGSLLSEFQEIGPTLIYNTIKSKEPDQMYSVLEKFCGSDIKLIYANSVVSGKIFDVLKLFESPILTHVHELEKSIEKFCGKDAFELVKKYSHRYIAVSSPVKSNLVETYGIKDNIIEIIHPFIDEYSSESSKVEARIKLGLDPDVVTIFGCGSIDWRKGPDIFVNIAENLNKRGIDQFHFYWIGKATSEFPDLESGIKNRGLNKVVTFLGEKLNPRDYFAAGDIFILPSREDPYPLVCLEAAQCGLPTVCFGGAGGMPDFVERDAGFVVPYLDEEEMTEKTAQLIQDKDLRIKLGNQAKKKIVSQHLLEATAPKILRAIRETGNIPPAVSVIVPCYNHGDYLPKRLDSIFNQTFRDFEVILLDDSSTDNTPDILSAYSELPNVEIEFNKKNSGSTFSQWIKGIEKAKSEIIWIAEDDDFCEPQFIEKMLPYFNDPGVKLAYSQSYAVDEQGEVLFSYDGYTNQLSPTKWKAPYIVDANTEINAGLGIKNTIPNVSAVLFRKFDISGIERSLPTMELAGDWLFYLYAIENGKIAFNPQILNLHRRHENTNIHRTRNHPKRFIESVQVQRRALSLYKVTEDTMKLMRKHAQLIWRDVYPEKPGDFNNTYDGLIKSNSGLQEIIVPEEFIKSCFCSCPICQTTTKMVSAHEWLRDHYRCTSCKSLPRDRALRSVLEEFFPGWQDREVVEFAPSNKFIREAAKNYLGSQYFPGLKLGDQVQGGRNENLEDLTFEDNSIDLIIHLDVMEHIFRPDQAVQEMCRVLRPGGAAVFTLPVFKDLDTSVRRSRLKENGEVDYVLPAEYHGNPVGDGSSLVTWHYGQDIITLLNDWAKNNNVDIERVNRPIPEMGIEGEFLDVVVIRKNE